MFLVRDFPVICCGLASVAKVVRDIPVASAAAVADVIAAVNDLRVLAADVVFAVAWVPALA